MAEGMEDHKMNRMTGMMNMMGLHSEQAKKAAIVTLGAACGVTAVGIATAAIWNSKAMRTNRAIKRTGKVLYRVGSAMCDMSGVSEH